MAIATLDGLIAGGLPPVDAYKAAVTAEAAGIWHDTWLLAGVPGAAVAPTPGLSGAALTSYSGQLPFPAAVGGQSVYLTAATATQAAAVGAIMLYDRLWHNSGFTSTTTTAQTVNSSVFPARDRNGATSGNGVLVAMLVSTATTNASAITNMTMSYTNSAGTAGRTGTVASFPATAVAGTFVPFNLAAGDVGVQSIQSLTLGTSLVTGTVHLVAYRPIAVLPTLTANIAYRYNAVDLGNPLMFDTSVPFYCVLPTGTGVGITQLSLKYSQG